MYIESWTIPEVATIVAWFSLAWFLIGVLVGRLLRRRGPAERRAAPPPKKGSRQSIEIYVGNLSYEVTEKDLAGIFEAYGKVADVRLIQHKFSGRSKGFGFVEMEDRAEAEAAVKALHNKEMKGRKIVVNEARSRSRD